VQLAPSAQAAALTATLPAAALFTQVAPHITARAAGATAIQAQGGLRCLPAAHVQLAAARVLVAHAIRGDPVHLQPGLPRQRPHDVLVRGLAQPAGAPQPQEAAFRWSPVRCCDQRLHVHLRLPNRRAALAVWPRRSSVSRTSFRLCASSSVPSRVLSRRILFLKKICLELVSIC